MLDKRQGPHGPEESLRLELVAKARQAGLLSPHADPEYGGLGLSHVGRAIVFEESGYSTLGPIAMNIFAPDEGNMHLLHEVATPAQKERWLRPLVEGRIRSCFCMTEPAPGAGSDPSLLATTAEPDGEGWLISGRKWLITGADGASLGIVMAQVPGRGATMFLTPMDAPGIHLERNMDTLDRCFPGGHGVLRFDRLRVGPADVLGEVGEGYRYAQVRLSPARLTHCMRWLGAARRAHDVALHYARQRQAFGRPIGQHEGVGFALADNAMDLHLARLATWHAAWVLDQGGLVRSLDIQPNEVTSVKFRIRANKIGYQPLTVKAIGGKNLPGGSTEVTLRSVHTADMVYFVMQYKDATHSLHGTRAA